MEVQHRQQQRRSWPQGERDRMASGCDSSATGVDVRLFSSLGNDVWVLGHESGEREVS